MQSTLGRLKVNGAALLSVLAIRAGTGIHPAVSQARGGPCRLRPAGSARILIPKIVATASEERELLISVMTPYGRDDVQIAMVPSWSRREGVTSGPTKARRVKEAIDGLCSRAL